MQEATVAVPLLRPDQSKPRSGGPVGRLRRLLNGTVKKFRDDGSIKVEKRNGFHALSRTTSPVSGPAPAPTGIPGTTLLGTLGDELVQIGNSVPYVYSPAGPRFEKFDEIIMTETAHRHVVRASTKSISIMDGARVGSTACYVWSEGGKCYAEFVDLTTDTPVRAPVQIAAAGRIKVVADGVRFWIVSDAGGTTVSVSAYGADGAVQASNTLTTLPASGLPPLPAAPWDITAKPGTGNGMVIAHNAAVGVDYTRLVFATFSGGSIVVTVPAFDTHLPATYGVCWLRSDVDANHLYLATTAQFSYAPGGGDPVRTPGVYAAQLDLAGAHTAMYVIKNGMTGDEAKQIGNLTGYVDFVGGGVFVSWTTYPAAAGLPKRAMDSTVTTYRGDAEPGVAVLYGVQRSVALAGRVFKLGTRYVLPCYYASVSQEAVQHAQAIPVAQPTYFLIDVARQLIVGELEYGTASFDWPFVGWDPTGAYGASFFMLPSSFDDADGIVHLTCGYAADLETVQVVDGDAFNHTAPMVGILDIQLGGRGIPIEFGDSLLLPGPRAMAFYRDQFRAAGIELAPEAPTVTSVNDGSGTMDVGEQHRYGIVFSVVDTRSNRMRSIASITTNAAQVAPGGNALQLQIPTLRMTSHDTVLIEVYRDVWDSATLVASNQLRKITVDEATPGDTRVPIYNDPTTDLIIWTDTVTNEAAAIGAPIYTDDGTLDYFACPPHSTGCVFGDRVFVGGYDNRVYYSFSKVPGQATAFNQDEFFFTVPTSQRVTALVPLDNRLFIFCERSIWFVDGGNFLSADGTSGANPTPIELKFTNGCTGRAFAIDAGVVYASSEGGLWLLTRGLENLFIGLPVRDETEGVDALDIAIDANQRLGVLTGAQMLVYDDVAKVWSPWTVPKSGVAMTVWRGAFVVADNEATPNVYEQTPGAWDDNGAPVQTRVDLQDIALADVNGFQVLWETSALGEWKGAHTFNVDVTYDGSDVIDETFSETFSTELKPFRFDWQPRTVECSATGISIYDTFPGDVPSQGFTLEALGLYVGIERGAKYQERRIAPVG